MSSRKNILLNKKLLYKAFLSGYISMAAQIILLREFLLIFYGNELVTGIILSLWLALTAAGASAGAGFKIRFSVFSLLLLQGFIPLILIAVIEVFRNKVFLPGIMTGPLEVILFSAAILLFFCIPNGFIFALLNSENGSNRPGSKLIYGWESVGGLTGGILVTVLSLPFFSLNNLTVATIVFVLHFLLLALIKIREEKAVRALPVIVFAIVITGLLVLFPVNFFIKQQLFFGQQVVASKDTPYGNITVTKEERQQNVFFSGKPLFSSDNVMEREANVHYELLQRPDIEKVLLIGGGLQEAEREILKYGSVKRVLHTELSEALFDRSYHNPEVKRVTADAVSFLQKDTTRYDAIVMITPPPDNAVNNRFYTEEFFRSAKKHLKPQGIIGFGLTASENFLDDEELQIHSVLYHTLRRVFSRVLIVPGLKNYFLASGGPLSLQYDSLYNIAGINNRYVNPDYIKLPELLFRHDRLMGQLLPATGNNSFFHPVIVLLREKQWLNYFNIPFQWISGVAALLFLVFLLFSNPVSGRMFGFGFAGASLEIVVLILFQVVFGYLYLFTGLMIAVFMAGLAAGSLIKKALIRNAFSGVVLFAILSIVLYVVLQMNVAAGVPGGTKFLFLIVLFVAGYVTGNQYKLSVEQQKRMLLPARVYAADLTGAMLGGFVTSVWIIPVYGFAGTLLILPLLLFLTIIVAQIKEKMSILGGY